MLIGPGIAIARQIHKIDTAVYLIEIDGLGLAGLRTGAGQALPVHQGVNQRRFPHIALPGESHLRHCIFRQFAGNTAYGLQNCVLYNHMNLRPFIEMTPQFSQAAPNIHTFYWAFFTGIFLGKVSGWAAPSTDSLVTTHLPMVSSDGIWYIRSIITLSIMERRLRRRSFSQMPYPQWPQWRPRRTPDPPRQTQTASDTA